MSFLSAGHDGDVRSWSQALLANFVPNLTTFEKNCPVLGVGLLLAQGKFLHVCTGYLGDVGLRTDTDFVPGTT